MGADQLPAQQLLSCCPCHSALRLLVLCLAANTTDRWPPLSKRRVAAILMHHTAPEHSLHLELALQAPAHSSAVWAVVGGRPSMPCQNVLCKHRAGRSKRLEERGMTNPGSACGMHVTCTTMQLKGAHLHTGEVAPNRCAGTAAL